MLPSRKTDISWPILRDGPISIPLSWMAVSYLPISPQIANTSSLTLTLCRWPCFLIHWESRNSHYHIYTCICAQILYVQAFYHELLLCASSKCQHLHLYTRFFLYMVQQLSLLHHPSVPLFDPPHQHIGCFFLKWQAFYSLEPCIWFFLLGKCCSPR